MRRGLLLLVAVIALAMTPALSCAQFGGISGLPTFGNFFGSGAGCGDTKTPGLAPAVYFGWMPKQENNVGISLDAQNIGAWNIQTANFRYSTSGFWLGGALPVQLSDNLSIIGTGWYLFPSDNSADLTQSVFPARQLTVYANNWDKKDIWWFLDGVLAWGNANFAALAGFRYDKFSTNFSSGNDPFNLGQNIDIISHAYIPLIGAQAGFKNSVSSANVRIIGFPTMTGDARANFTLAAANRFEATGNYNGGHFLEIFAEYARQFMANGDLGVFLRFNSARTTSDVSGDTTLAPNTGDYLLSFNRNTWTFGGKVGLSF